jgi:hypothetical protein
MFKGLKFYHTAADKLYWRPNTATVQGKKIVFLFANVGSSEHANWQGFAIYYNGTTYISTNHASDGSIDRNSVNSFKDINVSFDTYLKESLLWKSL